MKIKLDENISKNLKPLLQQIGFDVLTAEDEHLLGKSDIAIGKAAKREERILFTLDLEFADLRRFPPGTHPGIVLLRPRSMGPLWVNQFILKFLKTANLSDYLGCIVVVEPDKVRVRHPASKS